MKISFKIQLLIISVILVMSSAVLITVNFDLIKTNKVEIEQIREEEYAKAQNTLHNYIDIAYQTINDTYNKINNKEFLEKKYGDELKNFIDAGEALINRRILESKKSFYSMNEAKIRAKKDLELLRYDNNTGYIWINDTSMPYPKMVMHPILPDLNGNVLDDKKYNVALGKNKNLFQAAVEVSLKNGDGFVDYKWPKPTKDGVTKDQPKLSYVRLIPEWGWVIGTGIYIDDAIDEAKKESLEVISSMRYDNGTGYFWINNTDEPYPTMIMHPISTGLNGKILSDSKYNKVKGSKNNLFAQMVQEIKTSGDDGFVEYLWPKPTTDGSEAKEEPKLSYVKLFKPWNWIIGTGFYIDDIDSDIEKKSLSLSNRLKKLNTIVATISFTLAFLLIAIGTFLIRTFIRPIKKSSDMLMDISQGEGDLTKRLENQSSDEVGELSINFNNFVEKLSEIINRIKINNKKTESIKKDLGLNTKITSSEVTDINSQIESIKSSIEDLNSSIYKIDSDVVNITEEIFSLNSSIEEESSALEESSAAINQMVASIDNVSNVSNAKNSSLNSLLKNTKVGGSEIESSTKAIQEIYSQLEEIKQITTVINQISSKTNLLAMNAAIEAAHAGEAGRGFSVVADEIRKLAESSGSSVKNITELVKAVTGNIENSYNSSKKVKDIFIDIDNGVEDVTSGLREIIHANKELSTGGKEILEAISMLNNVAYNVKENSQKMSNMSNSIKEAMGNSREQSKNVTDKIDAVYNSAQEISNAINVIAQLNIELEKASEVLSNEISRFKT